MSKLSGKRILVVDDNEINLDIATETLAASGAAVDAASGGAQALTMIEAAKYDLILLDLSMPDVDGMTVGRAVRSSPTNGKAALVLFTASDSGDARQAVRELNAQGFVSKPVDVEELARKVTQHI